MAATVDLLTNAAALHRGGNIEAAARMYEAVLATTPRNPDALHLLGIARCQQGERDAGIDLLRRAVAQRPNAAPFRLNLGKALHDVGRFDEAQQHYRRAVGLRPDYSEAHHNLGRLLWDKGAIDDAGLCYERAITLGFDSHLNLAQIHLIQGRFAEGWPRLSARWRPLTGTMTPPRRIPRPFWDGSPPAGVRILVSGEQGVGDEVLFSRNLAAIAAIGGSCTYECDPRLEALFARSFPSVTVVGRASPPSPSLAAELHDVQTPLFDLARWLWPTPEAVKAPQSYLCVDTERRDALRRRYRSLGQGPIIGVAWHSRNAEVGSHRSLPLASWRPILDRPGVIVSLQYGTSAAELDAACNELGRRIHLDPDVDALGDLDGFAAQVAAMDAVVTIDNSTVHMAGALGVPTAVLVPLGTGHSFYWVRGYDMALWYPSVRVLQQARPGCWQAPIAAAAGWLAALPSAA